MPSLKNTAPIFLEIFLIQCFTVQVERVMKSHFPHLHNTRTQISFERKKDIPDRKMPLFFTLKSLSNKQQLNLLHRHFNEYRPLHAPAGIMGDQNKFTKN